MPDSRGEIEIRKYAVVGRFVQNGQSYGCEDSVVMGKNFPIWPIDAKKGSVNLERTWTGGLGSRRLTGGFTAEMSF